MIKGKYDLQDTAFVDCNSGYGDISNIIHEYMHYKLETSTILGIVNFMMEQTGDKNVSKISNLFKKTSLVVNENYATFHQLACIKKCFNSKYNDAVTEFKKNGYFEAFYGKKILNILNSYSIEDLLDSNIINRIAFMSMNINIYKLDKNNLLNYNYIEEEISKNELNPNYRYIELLKTLEKLLKNTSMKNITDDMLLKHSNIEVISNNKKNFLKVLHLYKEKFQENDINIEIINQNICNIEQIDEKKFMLTNVTLENRYSIFDVVRPMPLNQNYKKKSLSKIKEEHYNSNVMKIMIANNDFKMQEDIYAIVIFYDVVIGEQYIFYSNKKMLLKIVDKFKNQIIIFYEDYNEIINNFPSIKSRKLFLEINNTYRKCKEFILNDMSIGREIMFHRFNDGIFFLFAKQKDGNVFVMYFLNEVINLMKDDIEKKFFNEVLVKKNLIDGYFYFNNEDWYKYENIIRSITETYME